MKNSYLVWGFLVIVVLILAYFFWPKSSVSNPVSPSSPTAASSSAPTAASYVGTWQSISDASSTRVFAANGTVTDAYAGIASATRNGSWSVVANPSSIPNLPNMGNDPILKLTFGTSTPTYFAVLSVSSSTLSMVDLEGNGQPLNFKRVK